MYWAGRWDEALAGADEFIAVCEAGRPHYGETVARESRALIRHARGDTSGALHDLERDLVLARAAAEPQALISALIFTATVANDSGRSEEANRSVTEIFAQPAEAVLLQSAVVGLAILVTDLDRAPELRRLLDASPRQTPFLAAARAILDGEPDRAADLLEPTGADTVVASARAARGKDVQRRREAS